MSSYNSYTRKSAKVYVHISRINFQFLLSEVFFPYVYPNKNLKLFKETKVFVLFPPYETDGQNILCYPERRRPTRNVKRDLLATFCCFFCFVAKDEKVDLKVLATKGM